MGLALGVGERGWNDQGEHQNGEQRRSHATCNVRARGNLRSGSSVILTPVTRVLIVDDEPAVRAALDRALRLDGYEVALAADGREALDRLADAHRDAIVLDVSMPGIDGLEVCRRLRDAGDRTPVLMLTARDAIDDRVAGLDAGADDYLVKPFALEELKARLRALLRRAEPPARRRQVLRFADLSLDRGAQRRTAASASSSSRAPSSSCWRCSWSIRARC